MKTQLRLLIILATVLAMAVAYVGGMVASAQAQRVRIGPDAAALTNAQWAALEAANLLLLDDSDTAVYLPLLMKS